MILTILQEQSWIWAAIPVLGWGAFKAFKAAGDYYWAPKAPKDRFYAIEPTKEEAQAAKVHFEADLMKTGNQWWVSRPRYHDDMDTLTGNLERVRLDVAVVREGVAGQGVAIAIVSEQAKKQSETLTRISEHTAEMVGAWNIWISSQHGHRNNLQKGIKATD